MDDQFNLIDEDWIPIADFGRVSLSKLFSNPQYRSLGGNPVEKIAVLKLLLAIAQAAVTPQNDNEWQALGADGLARRCLSYLQQWRGQFFLYGPRPFLQMPAIAAAKVQQFGAVLPEVCTGNTTVLSQLQMQRELDDADRAILVLTLMGFALSGKKADNSVVLSPGYSGKCNDKGNASTGKPGPSVGYMGFLHTFLAGSNLQESLWLNLLTQEQLTQMQLYPAGVGKAPWERMPTGEDCPVARTLRESLMGRLLPMCRFCLLRSDGMHYSEGLAHSSYKEGMVDPSMAVDYTGKVPKALWADPEKRPWRQLTALLGFVQQGRTQGFQSWHVRLGLDRARDQVDFFALWSGGLRVSSNAGEQYVSGADDFVESEIWLDSDILGQLWFAQLKQEMDALDALAKNLYARVAGYYKELNMDGGKLAAQATQLFWQLCERYFQQLVEQCDQSESAHDARQLLRKRFAGHVRQVYDEFCPRESARQISAWAKQQPNNSIYSKRGA